MSYQNFIPAMWNEEINRELEKSLVFAENTNRRYEGDVKKMGDSVRILGVGKPTITRTEDKKIVLDDAETVEDTSITMPINQIAYFNYKVDDIDKRIMAGNIMDALSKETSEALAYEMDTYIANLALESGVIKHSASAELVKVDNVLKIIDSALTKLFQNDVSPSTKITLTVDPIFYQLLKTAYVQLDTSNSKMLENGRVGRYGNVEIKMSNSVAKGAGGSTLMQLKTDRAIAFVNPIAHTEAYRPERAFSDAVKGFVLFDAKIVRPKEMVILNVKYL